MIGSRQRTWIGAGALALALGLAYADCFAGKLVLDDAGSVRNNPTIRSLAGSLVPPGGGATVSGRPLLNLSFAVNYAFGGESTWGYHLGNLVIHFLAGLVLFGLVRRTLRSRTLVEDYGGDADWLALAIALLWALHPLQTESVTYIVQRAESLAGLFFLLTLYCFARGAEAGASARWFDAAIGACLLGAFTKETIFTAPLLVLLYDRVFVSSSFDEAWAKHRSVYHGLALSWLVLCWTIVGSGGRGGTAGLDTTMSWTDYGLKQLQAVTHYLQLAFWPHPLVLDYGMSVSVTAAQIAIGLLVVGGLVAATAAALRRWPAAGFLGGWFILILAPTSSVLPISSQTMAEHRMYLPLAALVSAVVLALHRWLGRGALWPCLALAAACAAATFGRNRDYASPITLWTQSVAVADSARARLNLGFALADEGRPAEAIAQYQAVLSIHPDSAEAHNNWGNALVDLGRLDEACPHYEAALRFKRTYAEAHFNYANTLVRLGRYDEAVRHYQSAVKFSPDHPILHFNLGCALLQTGRPAEAVAEFEAVLRLAPHNADAARRLALARQAAGRP